MSPDITGVKIGSGADSVSVGTIYCVGQNYLKHIQELQNKIPDAPVVFSKPASAIVHSGTPLKFPMEKGQVHHEVELVLALGKSGRRIDKDNAWEYVTGYTVGIDFTLRDLQTDLREKRLPWLLSKGFDHSAALAEFQPVLQPEEFDQLHFWLDVNNQRRQASSPSDMIFDIPTILAFLSRTITLQKGDLLFTGTPSGVGEVKSGDKVTIGIDGVLEETFEIQ